MPNSQLPMPNSLSLLKFLKNIKNQPLINLILIIFLSCLFLLNLTFQIFSFVNPASNVVAVTIFLLIPFLLAFNGFFFRKWWQKILNFSIFLIPIWLSIWIFQNLIGTFFLLIASYQPDQEIQVKSYKIAVYNNLATFDSPQGFVFKQEKIIFPGIKIAKPIYEEKNSYLDRLENYRVVNGDKIIIDFIYYDSEKQRKRKVSKEFKLKNFVFF
ncbi:MAG: hypothetical protein ACHBN1_21985 [Heteroscytonema crispum UTEX LB 1556]